VKFPTELLSRNQTFLAIPLY